MVNEVSEEAMHRCERVYSDTVNLNAYGREIRPNATLVETPSKAQNSRLVSVTTTMNLCDSAAGTSP